MNFETTKNYLPTKLQEAAGFATCCIAKAKAEPVKTALLAIGVAGISYGTYRLASTDFSTFFPSNFKNLTAAARCAVMGCNKTPLFETELLDTSPKAFGNSGQLVDITLPSYTLTDAEIRACFGNKPFPIWDTTPPEQEHPGLSIFPEQDSKSIKNVDITLPSYTLTDAEIRACFGNKPFPIRDTTPPEQEHPGLSIFPEQGSNSIKNVVFTGLNWGSNALSSLASYANRAFLAAAPKTNELASKFMNWASTPSYKPNDAEIALVTKKHVRMMGIKEMPKIAQNLPK